MGPMKMSSDALVGSDTMPTYPTDEFLSKESPLVEGIEFHRRKSVQHVLIIV